MLLFNYLQVKGGAGATFDEAYMVAQVRALGEEVADLWKRIPRGSSAGKRLKVRSRFCGRGPGAGYQLNVL